MDPEIEELKELVRQNIKLSQETNKIAHGLRRNIWWGRVWNLLWWGVILAVSAGAYYYYVEPYVEEAQHIYGQFQQGTAQAHSWGDQAREWFARYFGAASSTP